MMKTLRTVLAEYFSFIWCVQGLTHYPTDLFIGTGGEGFGIGSTPPGVQYPFGLVRLSPDTARFGNIALNGWHFGGYHYDDDEIRCFSHTHMMGAGVTDYGNIGVMAASKFDTDMIKNNGYRSKFSHKNESAYPGYYSVHLETHNVFVELTVAGLYTGVHRYTYNNPSAKKYLFFDITHAVKEKSIVNSSVVVHVDSSEYSITGWSVIKGSLTGRNGVGVKFYYAIKFLMNGIAQYGTWEDGIVYVNRVSAGGPSCGAFVELTSASTSAVVVVSLSLISVNQAVQNMKYDWDGMKLFDDIISSAQDTWDKALSQIEIESGTDTALKFYTAFYHVLSAPTQFSEAGGYYLGMDNKVHKVQSGTRYFSDLSLWDIHRTQAPLLSYIRPDISSGIVYSLLAMYEQGGALPRWPIANVYGSAMIGNHGYQVILDSILKNPELKINITEAYVAMKEEATMTKLPHSSRPCLSNYSRLGYCPKEFEGNSASLTLAYAYDDWAVGVLAGILNNTEDEAYFLHRSQNYKNLWDLQSKLLCPRSISGKLECPIHPASLDWLILRDSGYTEGNAEQWRWFVPHDVPGLIDLFGSNETFVKELDIFFEKAKTESNVLPNMYYWAGNEPDLLAVYLFNFAGRPDLTQKHIRWLMNNRYTSKSNGLPGNDDFGTLSAWYVWGALGLYPLSATRKYFLGSPAIEKATLYLQNNNTLVIIAENFTVENVYVKRVEVNGKVMDTKHPFLQHSDIENGGTLIFQMSNSLE